MLLKFFYAYAKGIESLPQTLIFLKSQKLTVIVSKMRVLGQKTTGGAPNAPLPQPVQGLITIVNSDFLIILSLQPDIVYLLKVLDNMFCAMRLQIFINLNECVAGTHYLFNYQGLKQIDIKNKSVLIIGTQKPWIEAIVLSK